MYDRTFPGRTRLKPQFVAGVDGFISWAWEQEICRYEGGVRCPCLKCRCRHIITDPGDVKKHLKRVGFMPNYWVWAYNGEIFQNFGVGDNAQASTSHCGTNVETNVEYNEDVNTEQFNMMDDMVADALGVELSYGDDVEVDEEEQPPNEKAQRFYRLLSESNTPLYEGSSYTKLSMCVWILAHKSNYLNPDDGMDDITPVPLETSSREGIMDFGRHMVMSLMMKKMHGLIFLG